MSIVEKALQKAHAKPERAAPAERIATDGVATPTHEHPAAMPHAPVALDAAAHAVSPAGRECRGGTVTLDTQRLRADGRLAPEGLAQQTDEEFRRIKWPVLNAIVRREGVAPAGRRVDGGFTGQDQGYRPEPLPERLTE